ncbi:LuxR family transcriptional regulator [Kribbella sandramycini]|uniref:DNA-binding CsgD family transcriptional regulator n=1 Tax=Kribbella sandramycini TaxID=60450 RepID=A0A7Y4P2X3_9ACTN|nr:helix-turn-helix transcriptional regulator [Kribbella sandramycini]MBB6571838.1 DNA-binding CsgD family transcriptional regulator [Kribbella sandramycini]NOL44478.1 LuxR family transcriptional regulator [Kribbella sandramycini]
MQTYHAESARAGLQAAAMAGLGWEDFAQTAIELLNRAVPNDGICLGPSDPATGLLTGRVKSGLEEVDEAQFLLHEYGADDVNRFSDLARREVGVSILFEATKGRPELSERYRVIAPTVGLEHEMRGTLRADTQMWGFYTIYRYQGRSGFSPGEADFMHRLEPLLTTGIRRSLIASQLARSQPTQGAAVLIVDAANQVVSATDAAEERIAELGGHLWSQLPTPVLVVVSAARGRQPSLPQVRLRARNGQWVSVHAAPVRGPNGRTSDIAVTIENAGAAAIIPLVVAAYGLTERERTVVQQVLTGASTAEMAKALHLSPYTVQDHLKAIFEKTSVSSRRELQGRIFFDHYAGRLDNPLDAHGWLAG